MITFLALLVDRLHTEEEGFSTAELLGNAALGIAALVAIWALLRALGLDVMEYVRDQIFSAPAGP
ncbi:hypothetical protein BH23ACT7_BH23ACT7_12660 [soil metagenome]|nr:hypothetical protein [Euzebyaceae bacterium]